jgi:hypothetical protein
MWLFGVIDGLSQDVLGCHVVVWGDRRDVSGCLRMSQDVSGCLRMSCGCLGVIDGGLGVSRGYLRMY